MSEEKNKVSPNNQYIWMSFVQQESELFERIRQDTQLIGLDADENSSYRKVIAMLTYAYYFQFKQELLDLCLTDSQNHVSDKSFILTLKQYHMMQNHRQEMQKIARSLLDEAFEERFQRFRNDERDRLYRRNKKINSENIELIGQVIKTHTKFEVAVGASVLASVVYSLLLAAFVFIATATNPNNRFSRAYRVLIGIESIEDINSQD